MSSSSGKPQYRQYRRHNNGTYRRCASGWLALFSGLETGTDGWVPNTDGSSPGGIASVASGTDGIPAADGSFYGRVQSSPDGYSAGYGDGGFDRLGRAGGTSLPYPGSPFYQSLDVYINPATAAPTNPSVPAFWIDASPSNGDPASPGSGYGAEHDFALFYDGSSVTVKTEGGSGPTLGTIGAAGWYNFQFLYSQSSANPTDLSNTTLSVSSVGGVTLGTTTLSNSFAGGLENQFLGGPGYLWLPVWQDGFSSDTLAIDDVAAGTVAATPEPSTVMLLAFGLGSLGLLRRKRSA